MDITKIVITGGPCAGKSTGISKIGEYFSQIGYKVLLISETVTELITGGVTPWECDSNLDYQTVQFELQLKKEEVYEKAVKTMNAEKALIICDRGIMDNKAYLSENEFGQMLMLMNTSEVDLRDNYDAVFHLVTAAKGAEEYYSTSNNTARTETAEEAKILDDRIIAAWTGHPHFRVVDNSTDFEGKINRLIAEIAAFLGEPEPLEIERKYLIEYPDLEWLETDPNCEKIDIIQTYLKSSKNEEIRVRQRGANGNYIFFETIKKKITDVKRVEIERRISEKEYLALLMQADTTKTQIRKTRYCLTYESQYFEIDVYPFWDNKAIAEIELRSEDVEIKFPPEIKVICDVTDDKRYKNFSLAGNVNFE